MCKCPTVTLAVQKVGKKQNIVLIVATERGASAINLATDKPFRLDDFSVLVGSLTAIVEAGLEG